ncbi:hypothetical protein [uncultured Spirosoma sp.]|uniref:hypothetical protein n=1 Tax=uncultured Spirosoma sp. TaxID=278208 RepID=UPI00258E56A6|nr:hypothetical protein [uncultured Spirosoma sp.]
MDQENEKNQMVDRKSTGWGAGLQQTGEERTAGLTKGFRDPSGGNFALLGNKVGIWFV